MPEPTLLDLYKEMGTSGHVLLLLFLTILAFAGVIHFRALDHRWRRAFLLLCGVQGATGLLCGIWSIFVVVSSSRKWSNLPNLESLLASLGESMVVIQFGAWLTVILLLVSAVLFVTSKEGGRSCPPTATGTDSKSISGWVYLVLHPPMPPEDRSVLPP
ncbi:hypothetical protein OVA24_18160 [Luteolibacter sp. SL250]|uniref:hypothetical protein n=1 Tax=Luteolibacter sp. SL250 TaxID=2995170 RepID=UPI00226D5810|nr:hypothetical protein [Luteolibacter sp. SL250]WAC19154.1 hypothetical protein OVA24_18160 [Luteolibacter sp. SL250]